MKDVLPPALHRALRAVWATRPGDWRYEPNGWRETTGWNAPTVARTQLARWDSFNAEIAELAPMGAAHERTEPGVVDRSVHNTIMSFGYVLARAAHLRRSISVLDWGGGMGQYHAIARALMPELGLDYTCKDLPDLVAAGRATSPALRFVDSEAEAFDRRYDLVMASSSLHYSKEWQRVARELAHGSGDFLYITRTPLVRHVTSFVVTQRAYSTEYPGWFINRDELLGVISSTGMRLEREFLVDERPYVPHAPEQAEYGGFLFRRDG